MGLLSTIFSCFACLYIHSVHRNVYIAKVYKNDIYLLTDNAIQHKQ